MNINIKALQGVVEEVEASRLRQRAETELQREAIKRAVKQHNLDGKAIRIVLQRRAMGDAKRDEQDYYVHAYELALGGKKAALEALEQGASIREAAKVGGISTGAAGNLRKGVQKSTFVDGATEHDAETGEITDAPVEHQPVEEIAAEILALPADQRVAAIMVVDALAKAPAVAAIVAGADPWDEAMAAKERLDAMKREKGFAA